MKLTITSAVIFAGTLVIQSAAFGGQVYKWIDSSGRTHYTQNAPDRGQTVKVIEIQESFSPLPVEYFDELDRVQKLTQQLASERQALSEVRRGSQAQSYSSPAPRWLATQEEWQNPLYPVYPLRPLYPTLPVDNIELKVRDWRKGY